MLFIGKKKKSYTKPKFTFTIPHLLNNLANEEIFLEKNSMAQFIKTAKVKDIGTESYMYDRAVLEVLMKQFHYEQILHHS